VTTTHGPATAVPEGDWAALSAVLTQEAEILTTRQDVIVAIAPGAANGAYAMFDPARAVIEINGDRLTGTPASYLTSAGRGKRKGLAYEQRERMEGIYGLLVHEASHASHSKWMCEADGYVRDKVARKTWTEQEAARYAAAAVMLEEVRVEAKAVKATWWTRRWQRMAACQHLLGTISKEETNTRKIAGTVATLIGGRVKFGILTDGETQELRQQARYVLDGTECDGYVYDELLTITHSIASVRDHEIDRMFTAAVRWCELVREEDDEGEDGDGPLSAAAKAMLELAGALGELIEDAGGLVGWGVTREAAFEPAWRPATGAEKAGAAALRERLLPYFLPDRAATRLDRDLPPGRLRGSQALRAAAQDALGLPPATQPWRFTDRRNTPVPPLRAGLVLDVSGSMESLRPVSEAIAYRFGSALSRLPDALFRGALAGMGTASLQQRPGEVAGYRFTHSCEEVHLGLDDMIARLDLLRRDSARLVVVVSDCDLTSATARQRTPQLCDQITRAGCRILWLELAEGDSYGRQGTLFEGVRKHIRTTPGVTWVRLQPGRGSAWTEETVATAEDALVAVMTAGQ
jgi:hypothetical protein